jgi:hypothetical protein
MKFSVLLFAILLCAVSLSEAQLREDLSHGSDYSGVITHEQRPSSPGNWMNMLNMTMNHSYSMSFSSFGGQMQNLNAYTNSMLFDISNKLNAQVDLSFLHSPFGNSFMGDNSSLGSRIIVESARLDYKLSENTHISLEFSQRPYGYSPFSNYGYGYSRGYNSPWNRHNGW